MKVEYKIHLANYDKQYKLPYDVKRTYTDIEHAITNLEKLIAKTDKKYKRIEDFEPKLTMNEIQQRCIIISLLKYVNNKSKEFEKSEFNELQIAKLNQITNDFNGSNSIFVQEWATD